LGLGALFWCLVLFLSDWSTILLALLCFAFFFFFFSFSSFLFQQKSDGTTGLLCELQGLGEAKIVECAFTLQKESCDGAEVEDCTNYLDARMCAPQSNKMISAPSDGTQIYVVRKVRESAIVLLFFTHILVDQSRNLGQDVSARGRDVCAALSVSIERRPHCRGGEQQLSGVFASVAVAAEEDQGREELFAQAHARQPQRECRSALFFSATASFRPSDERSAWNSGCLSDDDKISCV
jgi:hypothetical protein